MCKAAQALLGCRDDGARMYGGVWRGCWKCGLVMLRDCWVVGVRAREWHFLRVRLAISCSHISSIVCLHDKSSVCICLHLTTY